MSIHGISHLTFVVRDLQRAGRFFCEGLGAQQVYDSGTQTYSLAPEAFFVLGGVWLAAMQGEPPAERSYRHTAFAVDAADLPAYAQRLRALGVELLAPRPRVQGEGDSLYFYDFDNHLFELHSGTLAERLARYAQPETMRPQARASIQHTQQHGVEPAALCDAFTQQALAAEQDMLARGGYAFDELHAYFLARRRGENPAPPTLRPIPR